MNIKIINQEVNIKVFFTKDLIIMKVIHVIIKPIKGNAFNDDEIEMDVNKMVNSILNVKEVVTYMDKVVEDEDKVVLKDDEKVFKVVLKKD